MDKRRLALALLLGLAAASQTLAQKPSFEVASIKPNTTGRGTLIETPPNGRVNIVSATFRTLVAMAYRLQDYQIIGGSEWLAVDRFDIQARPADDYQPQPVRCIGVNCPPTPVQIMMQGLLAERFQLKAHREMRELAVYELTTIKNGFKLKEVPPAPPPTPGAGPPPPPPPPPPGTGPPTSPSQLPTPPPGVTMGFPFGFAASAVPLATLNFFLEEMLGRPVIDKTGITGEYDFKMVFSREGIPANGPTPPIGVDAGASDPRPSIFTALQEQFGLKLESTRGRVEVLVIDSVQRPSEN